MSAAFDRFIAGLEAADCRQGPRLALPCSRDRKASLSVAEGDDGRVLVRCHAGCTLEEVGAELGPASRGTCSRRRWGAGEEEFSTKPCDRGTKGCTV